MGKHFHLTCLACHHWTIYVRHMFLKTFPSWILSICQTIETNLINVTGRLTSASAFISGMLLVSLFG